MSVLRPSVGFCLIVLTYTASAAFFAWGLSTPPLDRVWQLHHELKIGRVYDLGRRDRELLSSAMDRHPALAAALLPAGHIGVISANHDGWIDTPQVSIIRTPHSRASRLLLDIQTPPQHLPYRITLEGAGWEKEHTVRARGIASLDLPPPGPRPELLTLKLHGPGLRADSSSLGVRVSFDPPELASAEEDEGDDEEDGE